MYTTILIVLLACAAACISLGLVRKRRLLAVAGVCIAIASIAFFWFMSFWGEALWFEAVGYQGRFWKVVLTKGVLAVAGAAIGLAIITVLTLPVPRDRRIIKAGAKVAGAYIAGQWAVVHWDRILLLLNRVATSTEDPILGRDTGFYFFTLPVYDAVYALLMLVVVIALAVAVATTFVRIRGNEIQFREPEADNQGRYRSIYWSAAALLFVLAWGKYLDRFHLMYSQLGTVAGPGWTDAHVRMPMYSVVMVLSAVAGVALLVPKVKNAFGKVLSSRGVSASHGPAVPLIGIAVFMVAVWFVLLGIVPAAFQWLRVQPNEISMEKPYIKHNIEFTQRGFGLDKIEERRFPVSDQFTEQMIEQDQNIFDNIRLWDWRALDSVYKQFQEIRLYYEFTDVDIDRYTFDDQYRAVMVSAREMQLGNLPQQSQTFVNRRFKYTHGHGITLTTVSEFTPEGLPNLLIKDIPPKSEYAELEIDRPQLYYGELTDTHVIVNTEEKELDYPSGEQNVYIRYPGQGGVEISNIWRKFLFGWKFDGTRLFLSTYPTSESRIMFHRHIRERVKTLAPFLKFDNDPYIVLANGRLYWFIDAYTISHKYPYSEPIVSQPQASSFSRRFRRQSDRTRADMAQVNYIRNSVKAVVDAFEGSVTFYIFEPDDPLIQAWSKVFPDLFKNREEMPDDMMKHIRYPSDLLLLQGAVYAKYHMTDPAVFYNQEDLWVRATEKYYNQTQPVEPYYIMWEPPDSDEPQFVLMQPFTPKDRQVLIGWIAGMCDPGDYGRLLAYKFPKEKRVLGTQQVETKIDQDRVLSGQLSLWDQRGSRVIRGNVLVIPIEDTLLYVEPIYLQAETAAYPELRLVAVMHDDKLSYANSFDEALQGLLGEGQAKLDIEQPPAAQKSLDALITEADTAFNSYLDALGAKDFDGASRQLENLSDTLERLTTIAGPNEPQTQ